MGGNFSVSAVQSANSKSRGRTYWRESLETVIDSFQFTTCVLMLVVTDVCQLLLYQFLLPRNPDGSEPVPQRVLTVSVCPKPPKMNARARTCQTHPYRGFRAEIPRVWSEPVPQDRRIQGQTKQTFNPPPTSHFPSLPQISVLTLFFIELAMRQVAKGSRFYRSGWNLFDLFVIYGSLIVMITRWESGLCIRKQSLFFFSCGQLVVMISGWQLGQTRE